MELMESYTDLSPYSTGVTSDPCLCFQRRLRPGWSPLVPRDSFSTTKRDDPEDVHRGPEEEGRAGRGGRDRVIGAIDVLDESNVIDAIDSDRQDSTGEV